MLKKIFAALTLLAFALPCAFCAEDYPLKTSELKIRDPFVFADEASKTYYIHANDRGRGLIVYASKDLENWRLVGPSFTPDADFWGKRDFWAPDMFLRDGKYYVIATFSAEKNSVETVRGPQPLRGCSVLVSDRPEGPYKPLVNAPLTPKGKMCLDGTLFEDGEDLWLLYCHEWLQVFDGTIVAQKISKDLKKLTGKPHVLFSASEAPWQSRARKTTFVTDAPVITRGEDGKLYMTWSSTDRKTNRYVIALAVSNSGRVTGPWRHLPEPLNADHGGHAMLFKTFGGKLKISYHAPNSPAPAYVVIKDAKFADGTLVISD